MPPPAPKICSPSGSLRCFANFVENTDVFTHYTQLAGIDFKNPELPLIADAADYDAEGYARYAFADSLLRA